MKKRLLYITVCSLNQNGGIVRNGIEAYERQGLEVDLLTLYGFSGQKSNYYSIYPQSLAQRIADIKRKIASVSWIRYLCHKFRMPSSTAQISLRYLKKGNNTVVLEDESKPVISNDLILSKIVKDYDYFVLYGWQDMMSSSTVETLYDRFHKPIIIPCADMYQLTGNCFYTAECERYKDECRGCPVFADRPNKEQAHQNFLFKKRVYKKTGCYIIVNSHQKKYLLNSGIIDEKQILLSGTAINTDLYKPLEREGCKKKFGLKPEKIYLFVRYIDPDTSEYRRKGLHLFEKSMKIVFSQLSEEERNRLVVMFAGVNRENCRISYDFETIAIGNLDITNLIKAYNAASVFVCPSVDDAGPTMVNQSIACGTPVIAFNQGTALDVIEDGYNGFKANVGDVEGLAQCIEKFFSLPKSEYMKMRENAREMSIKKNSYGANDKQLEKRLEYIDNHFKG